MILQVDLAVAVKPKSCNLVEESEASCLDLKSCFQVIILPMSLQQLDAWLSFGIKAELCQRKKVFQQHVLQPKSGKFVHSGRKSIARRKKYSSPGTNFFFYRETKKAKNSGCENFDWTKNSTLAKKILRRNFLKNVVVTLFCCDVGGDDRGNGESTLETPFAKNDNDDVDAIFCCSRSRQIFGWFKKIRFRDFDADLIFWWLLRFEVERSPVRNPISFVTPVGGSLWLLLKLQ